MVNNFKQNFNFITNILILCLFAVGVVSYADSNGIFIKAEDIIPGTFGSDQGDTEFVFPGNVNISGYLDVNSLGYKGMDLDSIYVGQNQENSISSLMIINNTVTSANIEDGTITLGDISQSLDSRYSRGSDDKVSKSGDTVTGTLSVNGEIYLNGNEVKNYLDDDYISCSGSGWSDKKPWTSAYYCDNGKITKFINPNQSIDTVSTLERKLDNLLNIDYVKEGNNFKLKENLWKSDSCKTEKHKKGYSCELITYTNGAYSIECDGDQKRYCYAPTVSVYSFNEGDYMDHDCYKGPVVTYDLSTGEWEVKSVATENHNSGSRISTKYCSAGGYS